MLNIAPKKLAKNRMTKLSSHLKHFEKIMTPKTKLYSEKNSVNFSESNFGSILNTRVSKNERISSFDRPLMPYIGERK